MSPSFHFLGIWLRTPRSPPTLANSSIARLCDDSEDDRRVGALKRWRVSSGLAVACLVPAKSLFKSLFADGGGASACLVGSIASRKAL